MRVLIICAFPPDPAPEANHAFHLGKHLAGAGLDVHVLSKKGSAPGTDHNITVHPVIDEWTWSDLPRLAGCIRRCKPDIVLLVYLGWIYNHHPMITFLPTICQRVLPGVPCITQFENIDAAPPRRSIASRVLRKTLALLPQSTNVHPIFGTLLRDSARIIVLSSPHRDRLESHYSGIKEKTLILPPPPLIRFCPDEPALARSQARKAVDAQPNDFVLMCWGYIYPGKGIETLFHALQIICRRKTNIRLVMVGGPLDFPTEPISCGDYFQMVRQLPEKLNIAGNVTWTGHFDWDSGIGSRYLHAADAVVLPFDYGVTLNNSSLAAATTHGLPIIGTELPVGRDEALEHGQNIYLCRPQDPEMLAEAILFISESDEIRARLRDGALLLARNWHSWGKLTERIIQLLESAVSHGETSEVHTAKFSATTDTAQRNTMELGLRTSFRSGRSGASKFTDNPNSAVNPISDTPLRESFGMNEPTPLVSIVVAAFNVEKFLPQCLDSLVNQTLQNIEIIVVNDASTDNSLEIIKSYQSRYGNIRIMNCKSNVGLASVRNIGLNKATGHYVAFADGDDWVHPRMYEIMYGRAKGDDSDVVIGDCKVFYEDSKSFGSFFDQHLRQMLSPRLRTMPFDLDQESRVLLLEPVAWYKLYKRSFLETYSLKFEDGMNSYEDICFHFSVLIQAKKVSLIDDALIFYRQNRPGQISGCTSRKIFEVFDVFEKIHMNLTSWDVVPKIWGIFVEVQLRQYDWLLRDRVQSQHKKEFMTYVAKRFESIPEHAFQEFANQADPGELRKLVCMRQNWLFGYQMVVGKRWPMWPILNLIVHQQRLHLIKCGFHRLFGHLRWRLKFWLQSICGKVLDLEGFRNEVQGINFRLSQLTTAYGINLLRNDAPVVERYLINNRPFFFANWSCDSAIADAIWRVENDFYLTQTAILRAGDCALDIGAHVGEYSIYLAKTYPFITVYAIEPNPMNYACLVRNIKVNNVPNVIPINKAIGGTRKRIRLYSDPLDSGWATINAELAASRNALKTDLVEMATLEQLFSEYGLRHCRLVKMHVPGVTEESLTAFRRKGCIDLLCGQADLEDCSRVQLERTSWHIARQHFWRTRTFGVNGTVLWSWIHQMPTGIEGLPEKIGSRRTMATVGTVRNGHPGQPTPHSYQTQHH